LGSYFTNRPITVFPKNRSNYKKKVGGRRKIISNYSGKSIIELSENTNSYRVVL
jgi:hypothetical protein